MMMTMVLPMLLVFGVMMFMNSRKQKKEDAARESMKTGDRVVSRSGLIGELSAIEGKIAKVKLAPGITVQMLASSIEPAASATAEEKKA
jgi:preprotein translocase YajC subunit